MFEDQSHNISTMMSIFLDLTDLCSFVALFSWLHVVGSRDVSLSIASMYNRLFAKRELVNPLTICGHMTNQSHNCSYMSIIPCLLKQACSTSPPGGNQVDGLPPVVHSVPFRLGTQYLVEQALYTTSSLQITCWRGIGMATLVQARF